MNLPLCPTAAFRDISQLKKGEAATGVRVRQALLTETLFEFGQPAVWLIGEKGTKAGPA